jgi:hypothetical protein
LNLTWADLGFTLDWSSSLNTDYVIHRVGDADVWTHPTKLGKADVLTMSFFVSEIAHLGASAWDYLRNVLAKARAGAILLFNDNNNSNFFMPFDDLATKTGWEVLVKGSGERKVYDMGERLDDLAEYKAKFERNSRLTGNMAWRVLRKKTGA